MIPFIDGMTAAFAEIRSENPEPKIDSSNAIKYAEAFWKGPIRGGSELWEAALQIAEHPIDNGLYPISLLTYDCIFLLGAEQYQYRMLKRSENYRHVSERMEQRIAQLDLSLSDFTQASGPKKLESLLASTTTALVPGSFLKIAQKLRPIANIPNPPIEFHNTLPLQEPVYVEKLRKIDVRKGGDNTYLYVIDEKGSLIIAERYRPSFLRGGEKVSHIHHDDLSPLQPVFAAGEFRTIAGKIDEIDNASGHFLPFGDHLKDFVENTFVKNGFKEVRGLYVDLSDSFRQVLHRDPIWSLAHGPLNPYKPLSTYPGFVSGTAIAINNRVNGLNHTSFHEGFPTLISSAKADEYVKATELQDELTVKEIKALLGKEEATSRGEHEKRGQDLVKHIDRLNDPKKALNKLRPSEVSKLERFAYDYRAQSTPLLVESVSSFVDQVNAIVDPVALVRATDPRNPANADSFTAKALPKLHLAYSIFRFTNPEEAYVTAAFIQNGGMAAMGYAGIKDILSAGGVAAIGTTGFVLAAEGLVLGLAGLFSLASGDREENAALQQFAHMIYGVSQQISRMHIDLIEGFRHTSLQLSILDFHAVQGFANLQAQAEQNHREALVHLKQIERFLNIDRAYLEDIRKLGQQNANYHIQQQIQNADWRETYEEVLRQCTLYPTSLSAKKFIELMDKIAKALDKVRRDGMARAFEVPLDDTVKVAAMFDISNSRLSDIQPSTPRLAANAEQNIHLLARYLDSLNQKMQLGLAFPDINNLYNPQALKDLSNAAGKLMETYKNNPLYFGIPEEPTRGLLNQIKAGIDNHEKLLDVLANQKLMNAISTSYLCHMRSFSAAYGQYQDSLIMRYYGENIVPRLQKGIRNYEQALTSLDINQRSEFFSMSGPNWFNHNYGYHGNLDNQWHYVGWGHSQSGDGAHLPRPSNRIEAGKNIYRNYHHVRAETIHQKRLEEFSAKKNQIEKYWKEENENYKRNVIDFLLYGTYYRFARESIPYHFLGSSLSLPVDKQHIGAIPNNVWAAVEAGYGDINFNLEATGSSVEIKALFHTNVNGFEHSITVFNQTINLQGNSNTNLPIFEKLHYTWFGGHVPDGDCQAYDPQLNRYASSQISTIIMLEEHTMMVRYLYCTIEQSYACLLPSKWAECFPMTISLLINHL